MINYIVWGLLGPSTWALWLLALAVAHLAWPDRKGVRARRGRRLALASLLVGAAFGVTPLGSWLIRPLEARFPPSRLDRPPATVVVLAGGEALALSEWRGRLELNEAGERVLEGALLARRFPTARLAIAGGVRLDGARFSDSDLVVDAWRRLGIPAARIVGINGTVDTCANALGSRRLPRPVLLVTSAAHMPRAVACFRAAGIEPLVDPVDFRAIPPGRGTGGVSSNLERIDFALHEWVGLAFYRLRGRTRDLFPAPR